MGLTISGVISMGLDIKAYSNISLIKKESDSDWNSDDYESHAQYEGQEVTYLYRESEDDPGPEIVDGLYSYMHQYTFRAGSYGSYNKWRTILSKLSAAISGQPFKELINFSDCDGIFGQKASEKLFNDFVDNFDTARMVANRCPDKETGDWFFSKYIDWMTAFKLASNNGALKFC